MTDSVEAQPADKADPEDEIAPVGRVKKADKAQPVDKVGTPLPDPDKSPFRHPDSPQDPVLVKSIDWSVFASPVVLRGLIITVAILVIALWPGASGELLGPIAAIGLALTGILTIIAARHLERTARIIDTVFGLLLIGGAVIFFLYRESPSNSLVRLIALILALSALRALAHARTHTGGAMSAAGAGGLILVAGLLWAFPAPLLNLSLACIGFINVGLLSIAVLQLSDMSAEQRQKATTLGVTYDWFREQAMPAQLRDLLYEKVIFEGDDATTRLARFYTLMGFAAVIATMGVITDSTAVVIGAMLIAPLMTPLMGIAASLSMGWPRRLQRMAVIAASGAAWAILIGVFLGLVLSNFVDIDTNTQIQARITPTLLDLITAVAAGAAGAYGLSRTDVSDSLPGVAIAISLVPPLTVVGVCFAVGDFQSGTGALLLFLTNAVAIMLVGALTFVLTGIAPIGHAHAAEHRVRNAASTIGVLAVVVMVGLLLNGREVTTQQLQEGQVRSTVQSWLGDDSKFDLVDINLSDVDEIQIDLAGPSDEKLPSIDTLSEDMNKALERDVAIDLRTARYDLQEVSGDK